MHNIFLSSILSPNFNREKSREGNKGERAARTEGEVEWKYSGWYGRQGKIRIPTQFIHAIFQKLSISSHLVLLAELKLYHKEG